MSKQLSKKVLLITPMCISMLAGCSVDFETIAELDPRITVTLNDSSGDASATNTISIGSTIISISGTTLKSLESSFESIGSDMYEDISVDGNEVIITLTDDQLDIWKASYKSTIDNLVSGFADNGDGFKMVVSGDYGTIDFYCDSNYAKTDLSSYIVQAKTNIAMYQVLAGMPDEGVTIQTNVYDVATNEKVQSFSVLESFKYSEDDWSSSDPATPSPEATDSAESANDQAESDNAELG